MNWSACEVVESVPGRMGGVPVLRHSRVTADSVFENYLLGESPEDIVYNFGLDLDDVIEVIEFAAYEYITSREQEDSLEREHEDSLRSERAKAAA